MSLAVRTNDKPLREQLDKALTKERDGIRAIFGRDARGALKLCIEGTGQLEHGGATDAVGKGDVMLLPAVIGVCAFRPCGAVTILEVGIPE